MDMGLQGSEGRSWRLAAHANANRPVNTGTFPSKEMLGSIGTVSWGRSSYVVRPYGVWT